MRTTARAMLPLLFTAVLAFPAAAETWEKNFEVTGTPELTLRTNDGSVQVETWDKQTVGIRVVSMGWHLGPRGVTVDALQTGDHVDLDVRTPSWSISFGVGHTVRIQVMLPRKATLDIRTGDGSVTVGPLAGSVRIHTGDGGIRVSGLKGDVQVETGDGRVDATGMDGRLTAHSGDGSIHASGRFDLLDLTSGDGGIEARAEAGSRVASEWRVRTSDGRIRLAVPRDLKADLDAHTGDGGITLELPVQMSGRMSRRNVTGHLNGGGAPILVRSGDGSIVIGPA